MKKFSFFLIFFIFFNFFGCEFNPFNQKPIITGVVIWNQNNASKYYKESKKTLQRSIKIALKELNLAIQKENSNEFIINTPEIITIKIKEVKQFNQIEILGISPDNHSNINLIFNQIDLNLNSIEYDNQGKSTKRIKLFN